MELQWEKCRCGDPICKRMRLANLGTFYQGSGFEPQEVEIIEQRWNYPHTPYISPEHFARAMHRGQVYGEDKVYADVHLSCVASKLSPYGTDYEAAGWLHDVIENTPATREIVRHLFGHDVENLVWACTGLGANRQERMQDIYQKIADHNEAAIVKVVDRICNVKAFTTQHRKLDTYLSEATEFSAKVCTYVDWELLIELEEAYERARQLPER